MTDLSIREGKPVIIISIRYRLNWQGFLACYDLIDEARRNNELPCNFGLHDQRNAFQWIRRYIAGFGGNPNNITAFGESAGSVSLCLHMCSTIPLFQRAILQSGTPAGNLPPADIAAKEAQYAALLAYCDIDKSDAERLEKLRKVPIQKLIKAISDLAITAFGPWADKSFFPIAPTYSTQTMLIANCDWIEEIIIGDACNEGFNFASGLKDISPIAPFSHLRDLLGVNNADEILREYSITINMDRNLFWTKIMKLGGDMVFSQPTHVLAQFLAKRSKKKIYRYNIALRNPFPGSNYYEIPGHHFIDLLFLFTTLLERYPSSKHRDISTEFARRWITFANGIPPWKEYTLPDEAIAIVDYRRSWSTKTRQDDAKESRNSEEGSRRYEAWETVHNILSKYGGDAQRLLDQMKARSLMTLATISLELNVETSLRTVFTK